MKKGVHSQWPMLFSIIVVMELEWSNLYVFLSFKTFLFRLGFRSLSFLRAIKQFLSERES